ncbi:hypothetical protein [Bradyrhizobium elkanii]|uniref:Uncharacterized protein n=1 Tax=Bradyrhizobium elkanii TaxID=29448 RepID=A0A8I1YHE4_BRAEL|nr:hypothetical protein [Bradyrhizobium elkanii]MBP1299732.1 hypothetical protein [Bradyrhizobium elkanii]MBP2428791.1 hypothetical protein [Bradyrhizobium elkanii]MCP1728987.1 hypothetical protein [Bradyrhizobium elkanii]MCP1972025.1 hypothetical protein [Bradyrhizobium elkanii]MCS3519191.1 hypothetical protein [Bradyrhizobium elkanii]
MAQLVVRLVTCDRKSSPGDKAAPILSKEASLHRILNRSRDEVADLDGAVTMPQAGTLSM